MEPIDIAVEARELLLSKKGLDVRIYDVRSLSPVTDFNVIASGVTPPQIKAMVGAVQKGLKTAGVTFCRRSGDSEDGWVVLDFLDVVIHVFQRELREYYAVEDLWAEAPRVP